MSGCINDHFITLPHPIGAVIYTNGEFGHGDGPIIYGNVECFGHENYIADCSKSVTPNFTCYYGSSVGLLCRDSKSYIMKN